MNIQAMMKQAQKLQKDMMTSKEEIDKTLYTGKSEMVTVEMYGNKQISKIKLNIEDIDKDDVEILEDMIVIAVNDAMKKIDDDTEKKLGKYTQGMPGLI